jgi:hypothetical protein
LVGLLVPITSKLPKLVLGAAAATLTLAFVPTAANATDVCNEAEASWQGGYTVSGDPVDPNPPARLLGGAGHQMRVGNGKGKGLVNAAYHSPALRTCGEGDGSGGDGGGPIILT